MAFMLTSPAEKMEITVCIYDLGLDSKNSIRASTAFTGENLSNLPTVARLFQDL
jgi:hypothetical protein